MGYEEVGSARGKGSLDGRPGADEQHETGEELLVEDKEVMNTKQYRLLWLRCSRRGAAGASAVRHGIMLSRCRHWAGLRARSQAVLQRLLLCTGGVLPTVQMSATRSLLLRCNDSGNGSRQPAPGNSGRGRAVPARRSWGSCGWGLGLATSGSSDTTERGVVALRDRQAPDGVSALASAAARRRFLSKSSR